MMETGKSEEIRAPDTCRNESAGGLGGYPE